jgi:glycosyltransferase involved in cell wall biosynthesis
MQFSVITSAYNQLPLLKKAHGFWKQQINNDFEWIIADDGSSDGTIEWCKQNGIRYVTQPDEGYRLTSILNKATAIAKGDYLTWVMADTYPSPQYLEQLSRYVHPERILNGIRMNVDGEGNVVSPDWRISRMFYLPENAGAVKVIHPTPWQLMTLNSMCMSKDLLNQLGGWDEGYKYYGKMDWDVPAHAHFTGKYLYWVMGAIVYHLDHEDRADHPENTAHFIKRLNQFINEREI